MRVCTRDEKQFCKHKKSLTATFNRSTAAQYTMKKFLLPFVLSFLTLTTALAADLNPFAYGLSSSVNATDPMRLDIKFKLNAPATSVKVYVYEVGGDWSLLVDAHLVEENRTYTGWIDLSTIPAQYRGGNKNLNWRVDVTGSEVASMTFVQNDVKLYAPTSIDIDNNPENANFGTVFCVEGLDYPYNRSGYESYISYYDGAGLYVLDPDGSPRLMPYQGTKVRYGYNGGVLAEHNTERQYFVKGNNKTGAYSPYRVRVADDGRIFVTSLTPPRYMNGDSVMQVLWEAKKECFSAESESEWRANTGWTKVISSSNANTNVQLTKADKSSFTYGDIYNLYTNDGQFITAPNIGFDVRGGGDALQLLMLSASKQAIALNTAGYYRCCEYDLGSSTIYSRKADRPIFDGYVVFYTDPQVEYDKDGNVWLSHHRGETKYQTLVRFKAHTGEVQKAENRSYLRSGAIRFNKDYTKLALATKGTGSGGAVTVYPIKADGWPDFENGTEVSILNKASHTLTDFAWDYAGNLYVCCKNKDGNAGECIAVYAMPRAANEIVPTPAASKYAFDVPCESGVFYNVTIYSDPEEGGIVQVQANGARTSIETFESCTELILTAVPEEGYKFVSWTDGNDNILSTNPVYTHLVTDNFILKANFEYATYNVSWWNLFKDGEDIYDAEIDTKRNARLYYLFMAYYNAGSGAGLRWAAKLDDGSGEYNLGNSCYTYTDELLNKDKNAPMYWLGEYLKSVVGDSYSLQVGDAENISVQWGKCMFAFINKVGYAKDYQGKNISVPQALVTAIKAFAPVSSGGEGKGEYTEWRPWWTNLSCDLPNSLKYNNAVPVTWTMQSAPYNTYDTYANNTVPGNYQPTKTPKWYQWNTALDGKAYNQSQYLLAWRDGNTTGNIVHHVSRPDMQLYATYVDKRLQESDPTPDLSKDPYDATNNDVLSLLANDNYGTTVHNVTIDRKFVGGMYNTVCFPFDLPISKLPSELSGAEIRVFNGVTKTYDESGEPVAVLNFITLQEYWQDKTSYLKEPFLQAGMPYLIKPNADTQSEYLTYSLTQGLFFDGTRAPLDTVTNGITFQGVFNPTTITEENAYILVSDNRLAKVTSSSEKIKGYRGYFVINDAVLRQRAAEGRLYFSFKKPVTTSIPVAPEAEQTVQPKVRKVMYDGQIYILRGEEVYTITGHRVK